MKKTINEILVFLLSRSKRSTSLASSTGALLLSADPFVALLAFALAARLRAPEKKRNRKSNVFYLFSVNRQTEGANKIRNKHECGKGREVKRRWESDWKRQTRTCLVPPVARADITDERGSVELVVVVVVVVFFPSVGVETLEVLLASPDESKNWPINDDCAYFESIVDIDIHSSQLSERIHPHRSQAKGIV